MIRLFLYFLVALVVGGLVAVWMGDDPGLILINFRGYAIEASLLSLFVMLLVLFALVFLVFWLFNKLNPFRIVRNRGGIFISRGQAARGTEQGFTALVEGDHATAYRKLVANARKSPMPLVNYLGAAQAAYGLNDEQGLRFCLREALAYSDEAKTGDGLITAMLEADKGQVEEAARRLRALHIGNDSHPGILRQLADYYVRLGAWSDLVTLLPRLKTFRALPEARIQALEKQAWRECLQQFNTDNGSHPDLEALWEKVPAVSREDEATLGTYVQKLMEMGSYDRAQSVLLKYFGRHHSDTLLLMLGYLDTTRPDRLLGFLEKLVLDEPDNATLRLTLGRVSLRNRLWGKGRDHLEQGQRLAGQSPLGAEISAELARLYDALGEEQLSASCYRQAMGLLERRLPLLPLPDDEVDLPA